FDFQCALMSLPHRFGTELSSIPKTMPYLEPEPDLKELWRRRIGTNGFKIGIAWQGNPSPRVDRGRSLPLSEFFPLARPGVRLISLQKTHGLKQIVDTPKHITIENVGTEFEDLADTAAAISNLDLVVTSDTSIAHLAGALGRPTWTVLKYMADWRWML